MQSLLAPVWPFRSGQGELQVTIAVSLKFSDPPALDDNDLVAFRTALVNANQGRVMGRQRADANAAGPICRSLQAVSDAGRGAKR